MKIDEVEKKFNVLARRSPKKNIFIVAMESDTNDGDYIESTSEYDIDDFEKILPILQDICSGKFTSYGDCKRDNYQVPEELEDDLYALLPSSEYGAHDLSIVKITFYDEDSNAYDITLK